MTQALLDYAPRPTTRAEAAPQPSVRLQLRTADRTRPPVSPHQTRLRRHYLNMALWTLQGWICMFFVGAGYAKMTEPPELLAHLMTWPERVDPRLLQGIGAVEAIAAIALLAPLVLPRRGRPAVAAAAVVLSLIETAALVWHAAEGDFGHVVVNALLLVMTAAVLIGRARA